jgi:hypothetical protein
MFCPQCGAANPDPAPEQSIFRCAACGYTLTRAVPGTAPDHPPGYAAQPADNTLGGLIPTHNPAALSAYYLGVFSLIPCVGIALGIAAFFLGLKGLRHAKQHPEAKGATHAWIGIVAGGLFGFGQLLVALLLAGAALFNP